eukprot:TRINITY_DN9823_c1_g1_i1.p1 TRINITY_DN9823_c1_g1~~TRINITY_DN9823_c1_g1_i1.p1  ORF type:complete len:281 (+),score=114.03 TRINITY_DN9823_c1_g1_i1:132-974(+)
MRLNIANPSTGAQKLIDIEDEKRVRVFYDKRISQEVAGDTIGDEYKGYVFKITGGVDKDGFAMKQGVLTNNRVKILLDGSTGHYRPLRDGERRRKAVRGCICAADLAVVNLVIVKKGDAELPGVTDTTVPRRLGPKRASRIRKLFNLSKEDDVRQFVIRRTIPAKKDGKKAQIKAPRIQRLVTPTALRRKKHRLALKKERFTVQKEKKAEYEKLVAQIRKDKRQALLSKKRQSSSKAGDAKKAAAPAPAATKKVETPKETPKAAAKPTAKATTAKATSKK